MNPLPNDPIDAAACPVSLQVDCEDSVHQRPHDDGHDGNDDARDGNDDPRDGDDARDDDDAEVPPAKEKKGPTQSDLLVKLSGKAGLFHTADGTAYADVMVNGHRETLPLRQKLFKGWLARAFYKTTKGGAPGSEALQQALGVLEARALFDAPERTVSVRCAEANGKFYIDLANDGWEAIEIGTAGWRIISRPPVRFRRAAGMMALPAPVKGGSIETLRSFLNIQAESTWVLTIAWLLAAMRPTGPYPALVLAGEQGSAKSSFATILRALVDPNSAPLRAMCREDRDLFIQANNAYVLAFDNVSALPDWKSDTLCRLSTGGGFSTRTNYSDSDETIFQASRPVILNGIEDFVTRPDLADRAIFMTLDAIPEDKRRPESELKAAFEIERPRILGALLDAVVVGIRMLPSTKMVRLPRMADFALWITACETALWPAGTFSAAYGTNRDDIVGTVIEADAVAVAVQKLMEIEADWCGTPTELLIRLGKIAGDKVSGAKTWPDNPRTLSGRLRRAAPMLRKIGVDYTPSRTGRSRTVTLTRDPERGGISSSPSSLLSPNAHISSPINAIWGDAKPGPIVTTSSPTVTTETASIDGGGKSDDDDDETRTRSGSPDPETQAPAETDGVDMATRQRMDCPLCGTHGCPGACA